MDGGRETTTKKREQEGVGEGRGEYGREGSTGSKQLGAGAAAKKPD